MLPLVLSPVIVVATAPGASAAPASAGASGRSEAQARAAARKSGRRVEVLPSRTETTQVFANPDGTLTSETSALPQRVRRAGGWVPVDTTLRFSGDGSVRPVAAAEDMRFSGGGTAPLATLGQGGRSFGLTWPGKLPRPVLAGDTATYRSVLPDVDLKITASVVGYSEVLVVKTRAAAANPALSRLSFGLKSQGLSVRKDASGGLSAVTDRGVALFESPVPRMWDSSGAGASSAEPLAVAPRPGGRQAVMGVSVRPGGLEIIPDRNLLSRPDLKFPLYIDPQWSGNKIAWTMVDKAFPNEGYPNSSHMPEAGNYGSGVKRSFFRMDSNNVNGKHILKAAFRITQAKSWGCTANPQGVQLWLTSPISASTTWNKQPAWDTFQDSVASDAGYSASCPDKGIEFDATNAVVRAARGGWSATTFGLKDYDDLDTSSGVVWGWKGFSSAPKLVIDYNTVPAKPSGVGTTPGTPCVTGANRPFINAGDTQNPVTLKAKVYDPDKSNDAVRAEFVMHRYNSVTQAWDDVTSSLPGGGKTAYKSTTVATDHSVRAPTLTNGQIYSFRVKAFDGTDSSAWTSWCEFTVDTVDPATVPAVTSADYPKDTPDEWHGGVGVAGGFALAPGPNDTDIAGFRLALEDSNLATAATQVSIPAGQTSVTVQVAPRHDWLNTLYVYAVDKAGNVGTKYATYNFYVKQGQGPIGHWALDETSGTTAADSGGGKPLTLSGGTNWGRARVNNGLHLNGSTGYGSTTGPVLDTTKSFSVSAWVKLPATTANAVAVSQSGSRKSAFYLKYQASTGKWQFMRPAADNDTSVSVTAASSTTAELNTWTHLAGVYDAPAKQMRLYVNGALDGSVTYDKAWKANGNLQIGRAIWAGGLTDYWPGDIDDVKVWDRILSEHPQTNPALGNEIAALAKQPPGSLGWWKLDDGTGTTAADSSELGRTATLAGGAAWAGDGFDGAGALSLNGTDAYAGTGSTPVVRTDHSFTAMAWVKLADDGQCTLPTEAMLALSQDGSRMAGLRLGLRMFTENGVAVPRWAATGTSADTDSGGTWTIAKSIDPIDCSTLGAWTHLALVNDRTAHTLSLYVNGQLAETATGHTGFSASGGFQIGRGKYKGALTNFWRGDIDDVRVFAGVLTDEQVLQTAMGVPLGG